MFKVFLLLVFVFNFGCATRRALNGDNSVSKSGIIKVWGNWVKDKGKKYDLQFAIENLSEGGIIVNLHDIECARGKRTGRVKHTFFNTGERTIDFLSGEMKQFNFVCLLGAESTGPFNVRIKKVYDNPSNDGATRGKVITENVIWSVPETQE